MSENDFGGLYCQASLPLEWTALEESTGSHDPVELSNQNCLKISLGLDDGSHESVDELGEMNQEIQRLDFKVNIILELLAQLVSRNIELPLAAEIKLGADALLWSSTTTPPVCGARVQVKLYLDPRFPFPLTLTGLVVDVTQAGNAHQVRLELDPQTELTQELLEKYIFRCHRRHIARMKSEAVKEPQNKSEGP